MVIAGESVDGGHLESSKRKEEEVMSQAIIAQEIGEEMTEVLKKMPWCGSDNLDEASFGFEMIPGMPGQEIRCQLEHLKQKLTSEQSLQN
jgi:hypothetical protein